MLEKRGGVGRKGEYTVFRMKICKYNLPFRTQKISLSIELKLLKELTMRYYKPHISGGGSENPPGNSKPTPPTIFFRFFSNFQKGKIPV